MTGLDEDALLAALEEALEPSFIEQADTQRGTPSTASPTPSSARASTRS